TGTAIVTGSIGAAVINFGSPDESAITLVDVDITTTGQEYGYGVNVEGAGSVFSMSRGSIVTHGDIAHGVAARYYGTSTLNNVAISTSGESAPGVAAHLAGKVTLAGGSVTTTGANSPGLQVIGITASDPIDRTWIDAS